MSETEILLNIHRKYSRDEEFKLATRALRIEIGEQKSYIQELEDKLQDYDRIKRTFNVEHLKELQKTIGDLRSGETVRKLKDEIVKKDEKIKNQREVINSLVTRLNAAKQKGTA